MKKNETRPRGDNHKLENAETERWYTLDEVSTHLGVHKDTVRSWIKKDTIPCYKIGRQYRFKMSEVEEWVKSGQSANADK